MDDISRKKFKRYKIDANSGDVKSQRIVGACYEIGRCVKKNNKLAFKYYKLAADKGDVISQYNISLFYEKGIGVKGNSKHAIKYFRLAMNKGNMKEEFEHIKKIADMGNSYAQNHVGIYYKNEKNFGLAAKYFKMGADQYNNDCQHNLGSCYEYGEGVKKNMEKAYKYYKLAAEQNNIMSQLQLAFIYSKGEVVGKDDGLAMYYCKLSADNGYTVAQSYTGMCYEKGILVDKNIKLAVKYYKLCVRGDNIYKDRIIKFDCIICSRTSNLKFVDIMKSIKDEKEECVVCLDKCSRKISGLCHNLLCLVCLFDIISHKKC